MKYLSTVARIITPLAMVVFLAYEINRSMTVTGAWAIALLVGAVGTAVGIEIVGILAGHALEGFWRIGDQNRAVLSFFLLIAYTAVAVYVLRHNQAMVLVPVIAAIVYLLASLTTSLEKTITKQAEEGAVSVAFELEQAKADRELERELRRQKQADDTAVKLARVNAKAASSKRRDVRHDSGEMPSDWRQLTRQQKRDMAHATREEREEMFPAIEPRTRRDWHVRLDKIAAQNGEYEVTS